MSKAKRKAWYESKHKAHPWVAQKLQREREAFKTEEQVSTHVLGLHQRSYSIIDGMTRPKVKGKFEPFIWNDRRYNPERKLPNNLGESVRYVIFKP